MFELLVNCCTIHEIKKLMELYYPQMQQSHIDYLESLSDHEQYPAARCSLSLGTLMYQRSSSQMVEAMNNANKRMCRRVVLGEVVSQICFSWLPINAELLLSFAIAQPMESHTH